VSFLPHAHVWVALILAVSILLMLVRARGIPEVYWIAGGVVLLLLLRLEPFTDALHAAAKGRDVYFFLMGMMLLSELAAKHGVFDWMSSAAVRHANGSMSRLFLLVYVAGTMVTIFMSNDATAVVLTPAILVAVRKARIEPLPYLFVCAFIANAASFVLPISNPANLVVFQQQMPPLGEWLLRFGAPSIVSIVVTYAVLRWYFRRELRSPIESPIQNHLLDHHGKVMLAGLAAIRSRLADRRCDELGTGPPNKSYGSSFCRDCLAHISQQSASRVSRNQLEHAIPGCWIVRDGRCGRTHRRHGAHAGMADMA
jgi:arsenical pump membrane protein